MSEPLSPNLPQGQTVAPTADRLGRMKTVYMSGFAFVVGLQLLSRMVLLIPMSVIGQLTMLYATD
jgi:hypothetical protein